MDGFAIRSASLKPVSMLFLPSHRHVLYFAIFLAAWQPGQNASAAEPKREEKADSHRRALLIGVTRYANLPEKHHLRGPAGDVAMLARLLREKMRFPADQVTELTETAGAKAPSRLPTRANIDRAIQELSAACQDGDSVVLFLAGHGSQQPASKDSAAQELDGFDEVFLPRDAAPWDAKLGRLQGAYVDDDIQSWVTKLRARGASVCLIVDTCHSGTMLRGPGEQVRQISPAELGIPADLLARTKATAEAHQSGGKTRGSHGLHDAAWQLAQGPGVVAIYACQPDEVTIEERLPRRTASAEPHGLFSYTFCQVLTQAVESSSRPLTYRELVGRVRRRYCELGRDSPNPLAEGTDLDREIFGDRIWPGRSTIRLVAENHINAGAVQGLTADSILALYAEEADEQPIGHVRIVQARAFEADVVPCAYGKLPMPSATPVDAICRPVYIDHGPERLRVALDGRNDAEGPAAIDARKQVAAALSALGAGDHPIVQNVADQSSADWFIRHQKGNVVLIPAQRSEGAQPPAENAAFGPFAMNDRLESTLRDRFSRITQATNLVRLSLASASSPLRTNAALHVATDLKLKPETAGADAQALPLTEGVLRVFDRDQLSLQLRNPNDVAIDVSVLFVDSQYGINSLFPADNEDNRIPPGQAKLIDDLTINVDTAGREYVVIVAVKAESSERVDLSVLAQPSLELAEKNSATRSGSLRSPLGKLLANRLYGSGQTRGESQSTLGSYSIDAIPWEAVRTTRAAAAGR